MTTLDDARRTLADAKNTVASAQIVVDELSAAAPPPPPTSARRYGFNKILNINTAAYVQREAQDMRDAGATCVRADYLSDGVARTVVLPILHQVGFAPEQIILVIGATAHASSFVQATYNALMVRAASENPGSVIEQMNEPGLNGFTASTVARVANAAFDALRAAGHSNIVLAPSIAGNEPPGGRSAAHGWARQLVSAGLKLGDGLSGMLPNYHVYGRFSVIEQGWCNYFTTGPDGTSCQAILGNYPFAMTEWNQPVGSAPGATIAEKEKTAALYLGEWLQALHGQPLFRYGTVYAMSDDARGTTTGYGMRRLDLTRRPSFDTFHAFVTATP